MYAFPEVLSVKDIASAGQTKVQTVQPSHITASTSAASVMASNRQASLQAPHLVHLLLSMTATLEALNRCVSKISGCKSICKSGASTSQSATTASLDRTVKQAVSEVLPVPPLPLKTVSCFIFVSSPECF